MLAAGGAENTTNEAQATGGYTQLLSIQSCHSHHIPPHSLCLQEPTEPFLKDTSRSVFYFLLGSVYLYLVRVITLN